MMSETFTRTSTRLADSDLRAYDVDGLGGDDGAESGVFRVTLALIRVPVGLADAVGGEGTAT
jgi:hypothetical protein